LSGIGLDLRRTDHLPLAACTFDEREPRLNPETMPGPLFLGAGLAKALRSHY